MQNELKPNVKMYLLYLPAAACFFWLILNFFLARRTGTFWTLTLLTVVLMMYFIADAIYITPGRSTDVVVQSHLISILAGPSVLPMLWMYFDKLTWHKHFRPIHYLWVLLPISLFFATLSLTGYMGRDAVAAFLERLYTEGTGVANEYRGQMEWDYFLWASAGYRIVEGAELVVFSGIAISFLIKHKIRLTNVWRYFRNGESVRVVELQLSTMILAGLYILSKVFFFKDVFDAHPWIAISQALLITAWVFLFMICALLGEKRKVTRIQAQHIMFYNYNSNIKGPVVEIMLEELLEEVEPEALFRLQEKLGETQRMNTVATSDLSSVKKKLYAPDTGGSWDDSLLTRFRNLMVNEQLFLQPSLSLGDIADRLHTNKTYISKLVNNTYNLSFPEFLNTLRIDFAEQYLISHPDDNQMMVAKACGFRSASSFNNIFRKITGMTPKMWVVTNGKESPVVN